MVLFERSSHAGVFEDGYENYHDDDGAEQHAGDDALHRLFGIYARVIVGDVDGGRRRPCRSGSRSHVHTVLFLDRRDVRRIHHYHAIQTSPAARVVCSTCSS